MPNCDFYAGPLDHRTVLEFVLSRGDCDIYELYSRFDEPLQQFQSLEDFVAHFKIRDWKLGARESILLNLYPHDADGRVFRRRITLDSKKCGGAKFRYTVEGWGLVQLYLEPLKAGQLCASHTNHNSEKRATAWFDTIFDLGDPANWNWARVNSFSRRLNRFIRGLAAAKTGSRVILPHAAELEKQGIKLSANLS
jgi:hypothetical protein